MTNADPERMPEGSRAEAAGEVGDLVRDLRKARGMTLQQLAGTIDRSVGYVSQIERNKSVLSISGLLAISRALDVPMNYFFQGLDDRSSEEHGTIVRRGSRRTMQFTNLGIREELLSPNLKGPLELLLSVIEPGASSGDEAYSHSGHEAGLVVSGRLDLWIGERFFQLGEGDSFSFKSTEPHRCANPGDAVTHVVWVITPPSY